jgi:MFS superfamily sulfate permease-like transporter
MTLTMFISIFFDLVTAVLIGIFIANLVTIRRLSEIQLDNINLYTAKDADHLSSAEKQLLALLDDSVILLNISGPIGFGVARGLKQSVSQSDHNKTLLLDLTDARFVGITSTIAIEEIIVSYLNEGREILLSSVCDRVKNDFINVGESKVYQSTCKKLVAVVGYIVLFSREWCKCNSINLRIIIRTSNFRGEDMTLLGLGTFEVFNRALRKGVIFKLANRSKYVIDLN